MNDLLLVIAVALAGGLGSALRYLTDNALPMRARRHYPWATTVLNVSGSFALGLLTGIATPLGDWHDIIGVGLIGGYTTFSTASLETVRLLTAKRPGAAILNGIGMLVACVLAAAIGITLAHQ